MLDRMAAGEIPPKHHTELRTASGKLIYEECLTRRGFDGGYTLLYHQRRPHEARSVPTSHGWPLPSSGEQRPLARRHFKTFELPSSGAVAPVDGRVPLLFNEDVVIAISRAECEDPAYFSNGDADELLFVHQGTGTLRSVFGDLEYRAGDYVVVPKGVVHRFIPGSTPSLWLRVECHGGVGLPPAFRNDVGQLRMDAPYCHRDFRRPRFVGPLDEGLRHVVVKRNGVFHGFEFRASPLDVVGFDGSVYPFAFPIASFQPKVGAVHLPPTVHATFQASGALVCSFVPRPLDFGAGAIPCPYPHSSVDVDEVLFYAGGDFVSRRGISAGSVSHHPAGVPHGPHPGAYEASIGKKTTDELAVMLDCQRPLLHTASALSIEDAGYHDAFAE